MTRIAIRLIVTGLVQGVGFRWWARDEARRLGVDGWVANRADGTVEMLAAGQAEAVERLAAACQRGPSAARVDTVQRSEAVDPGAVGFAAKPTA